MRLSTAIITYGITILLSLILPAFFAFLASKKNIRLSVAHALLGVLFFVIGLIGFYLVLKYHLNAQGGIGDYYNTPAYRVTIVALLSLLLSVLIWVFAMIVYARRQEYNSCLSFYIGFGCGGSILLGVYALLMLVGLLWQYFNSTLLSFDTTVQAFYFSPGTYFPVFTPMTGHISFAIAFLSFWAICINFALIINRNSIAKVPFVVLLLSFIGINTLFAIMTNILFFVTMFGLSHQLLAMFALLCALCSVGLTIFVYKQKSREKKGYIKQFD